MFYFQMRRPNQGLSLKWKKSDQWLGKYYCILERIWVKWDINKQVWFVPKTSGGYGGGSNAIPGRLYNLYSHLNLHTVFPALVTTKKFNKYQLCYPSHIPCLKDNPQNKKAR